VEEQPPGHPGVGADEDAQRRGGIERVAVHRIDEWHAAEEIRIPLRNLAKAVPVAAGELAERIAGDVLVGIRIDQELAGEGREA
jgi:hypothetical protein